MTTLSCVFIGSGNPLIQCAALWLKQGHRLVSVISDCPKVIGWTEQHGITRISPDEDQVRFLGPEPFDYLFSVINHRITAREVLAIAQRASINYHDSLLPAYSGFNATAWSILDGNQRHGITWHRMAADADTGEIYKQVEIDIAADDTAFTLEAKCSEAAVQSFGELAFELASERATTRPQRGERRFHFMSDRPDAACLLELHGDPDGVERMLRALTFGPDDNSLGLPKLWDGREPIWTTEGNLVGPASAPDGALLAVADGKLSVAVGGQEFHFAGLRDVTGRPLALQALRERGLETGTVLPRPDEMLGSQVTELDRSLRKSERFWVKRLTKRRAPVLPQLRGAPKAGGIREHRVRLTVEAAAAFEQKTREDRICLWAAALSLWLARVGETDAFDVDFDAGTVRGDLSRFFATRVPFRFRVKRDAAFADLLAATRAELSEQKLRRGYARDVILRYDALRTRHAAGELDALPVALVLDDASITLDGATLVLALSEDGTGARFIYGDAFVDGVDAGAFFERFEVALAAATGNPEAPCGQLSVLPAREQDLLLREWNATVTPYRKDRSIHQLFEEQAARTPDKVALVFRDQELTYRELNRRANLVAARLLKEGIVPETRVGICIERSLALVVGLLGILKAGGAYVPLDPAYPRERLSVMLEDAQAPVLLTERHLSQSLPAYGAALVCIDDLALETDTTSPDNPASLVLPENLAYVIFTSGSTGRPKGVMVQHRNVSNFFTGMDQAVGPEPGVWLAVTSVSFDISVLEIFWPLTRGFEVVLEGESDRASLGRGRVVRSGHPARMGFGLFYFAADAANAKGAYRLLVEGAKFADKNGFDAVWTPERHFHAFGGLYPNPAVTSAALATITERIQLRAGSVVLPLHDPVRVAEEWAVVDNLSGGRVGLSFASGWHANDFAFKPENFEHRRDVMRDYIATVLKLWQGDSIRVKNGEGKEIEISTLPRPVQAKPPLWIASAGSADTFRVAGTMGVNVLTNMLGQSLGDLRDKLAAYREARRAAGHEGEGIVSVMLHTFIGPDTEAVRALVKRPFCDYLATSFDLVKIAPWAFPAFRQPSKTAAQDPALDATTFTPEDTRALMDHAFERYFDTAGLFGTPEKALGLVDELKGIGVNELACLVDFGVDTDVVLTHLTHLKELMDLSQPEPATVTADSAQSYGILEQIRRRKVTHLQCTPSMARILLSDAESGSALASLKRLMLGGEALPTDLAEELGTLLSGQLLNMYGPTETTVWSTTARIEKGEPVTIGRPIANTTIRILDAHRALVPVGTPGELYIGGEGVVRGYLGRADLTVERFVPDPFAADGARLYRTGDLARFRTDGCLEFLGRIDHQVKVNGYRIELGEIESVLARHASVREAVVISREDPSLGAQLVAYVVPASEPDGASLPESVTHWQRLWDETYAESRSDDNDEAVILRARDPRFNIAGWNSSYTGEPIAPRAMEEWLGHTVTRILGLEPKRVLEIGCGTGLLLYRLLGKVEHYTAVDFSEHALAQIRGELTDEERRKVALVQGTADGVTAPRGSSDLVIINSVAQYFPSADYLVTVLEHAANFVVDGGHIWLGDVRSLPLLEAFHTAVQIHQAPADTDTTTLRSRVAQRMDQEGELLLDPKFFHALAKQNPRITDVRIQLKRGHELNELTRFRYDVVLTVGGQRRPLLSGPTTRAPEDLEGIRTLLGAEPEILWLCDLPNARLTGEMQLLRDVASGADSASTLRTRLNARHRGFDPESLHDLSDRYEVETVWGESGAPDRFDAVFRHRERGPLGSVGRPPPVLGSPETYANRPHRGKAAEGNAAQWRNHLREHLPEYMVPAAFVVLKSLPLTPNGKIDRKALPAPHAETRTSSVEYVPPASEIERAIAGVWEELLALPRVGLKDNIFDLGANSLLTVQANNKLSQVLGRRLSLVSMFQFPTVESLAAHLGQKEAGPEAGAAGRERADRRKEAMQRRRGPIDRSRDPAKS
jgi:natural product biosynthesis luciferase-like monooxygenase protein